MQEGKTIGQLMEEMRQKAGAQNYHGHDYMDLQRFAENTRHMIIFDVLTNDSPVGWKGERTRLFLSDIGYEKALDSQAKGQIKILSHAKVRNNHVPCVLRKSLEIHVVMTVIVLRPGFLAHFLHQLPDCFAFLHKTHFLSVLMRPARSSPAAGQSRAFPGA